MNFATVFHWRFKGYDFLYCALSCTQKLVSWTFRDQIRVTIKGFFSFNTEPAKMKNHLRDFLVQIKVIVCSLLLFSPHCSVQFPSVVWAALDCLFLDILPMALVLWFSGTHRRGYFRFVHRGTWAGNPKCTKCEECSKLSNVVKVKQSYDWRFTLWQFSFVVSPFAGDWVEMKMLCWFFKNQFNYSMRSHFIRFPVEVWVRGVVTRYLQGRVEI